MLIGWIKMNQVVRFCSHTIISSAKIFNFTIGHFGVPWAPHLPGLPSSVSVELKQTPNNILQKTIQRDERMEQKRRNGRRILCVCVQCESPCWLCTGWTDADDWHVCTEEMWKEQNEPTESTGVKSLLLAAVVLQWQKNTGQAYGKIRLFISLSDT